MQSTVRSRTAPEIRFRPLGYVEPVTDGVGGLPPTVSPSATPHRWVSPLGDPAAGTSPAECNAEPSGSRRKGDTMNHRPNVVAWPVGSEWRTRRPSRVTNQLPRRTTTQ
jgi:hypothetical protein